MLAAVLGTESAAKAGFITGTQAFSSDATISSPGGNNVNDTSFDFTFTTLIGGSNQTGDYVGSFGSFVNTLDTTAVAGFVFGDPLVYGTFTVASILENSVIADTSRTIKVTGTFSPNAATFGPGFDPTPGVLTITINEASIGGHSVLSGSATLATAPNVPEPSTFVLLLSACGPLGLGLMYRRRTRIVS
jgi:hypothetical protein